MWFTKARRSYAPLQDTDSLASNESAEEKDQTEQEGRRGQAPNAPILYRWAIFVSVLCTLSNLVVFAYVTWGRSGTTIGYDTTRLPRPNQYIGLEKVNRKALNATLPEPIANFAPVLTQISKQFPTYIYPTDTRRYFVPNVGTVSPDDRHFFVDEHTSTFAQFRVRDFGMERCQIILNIPAFSKENGPPTPPFILRPQKVSLDVWRLDTDDKYFTDVRRLSWNTRPPRADSSPLATLVINAGSSMRSSVFPCRADSVQTFEFACSKATPDCFIDFWQDGISSQLAAFMLQHPSI